MVRYSDFVLGTMTLEKFEEWLKLGYPYAESIVGWRIPDKSYVSIMRKYPDNIATKDLFQMLNMEASERIENSIIKRFKKTERDSSSGGAIDWQFAASFPENCLKSVSGITLVNGLNISEKFLKWMIEETNNGDGFRPRVEGEISDKMPDAVDKFYKQMEEHYYSMEQLLPSFIPMFTKKDFKKLAKKMEENSGCHPLFLCSKHSDERLIRKAICYMGSRDKLKIDYVNADVKPEHFLHLRNMANRRVAMDKYFSLVKMDKNNLTEEWKSVYNVVILQRKLTLAKKGLTDTETVIKDRRTYDYYYRQPEESNKIKITDFDLDSTSISLKDFAHVIVKINPEKEEPVRKWLDYHFINQMHPKWQSKLGVYAKAVKETIANEVKEALGKYFQQYEREW